jgi:hypothetical protein
MSKVNIFYSRLEIFCDPNTAFSDFIKEKCLQVKDDSYFDNIEIYNIYAKEFNSLDSVMEDIYELERTWENTNKKGVVCIDESKEYEQCNSIIIYNQWENYLTINIYFDRWMISGLSMLTNEWKENLKNANGKTKQIYSDVLEGNLNDECEFISRQKACFLLKNWLQTNDKKGDFEYNEYHSYWCEHYYNKQTNLPDNLLNFSESDNDGTVPF